MCNKNFGSWQPKIKISDFQVFTELVYWKLYLVLKIKDVLWQEKKSIFSDPEGKLKVQNKQIKAQTDKWINRQTTNRQTNKHTNKSIHKSKTACSERNQ